ncbi:MAG TPA: hypothetical protein VE988_01150 [Gemmataceae bacterium]|nr:hypothetical protein [Gemmataceae bacterium]
MRRLFPLAGLLAVTGLLLIVSGRSEAQGQEWATVKGRIVWGGKELPPAKSIEVLVDKGHCLEANPTADKAKGTIQDESILVNPKNKGLKNVFVYLYDPANKIPIHPNLVKFPPTVEIDQPACMFFPRALALREGQTFVVKNTAPVSHNINWSGDPNINAGGNVLLKSGASHEIKDLKNQKLPMLLACNLHGWMKGRLGVFNHPYFAITDADGNFEIKNAPVGNYNFMIYHEEFGYRLGAKGSKGEPYMIKAGGTDLGELPMGK